MDTIEVKDKWIFWVPRELAESDPNYIKHVHCDGAYFHALWYDTHGAHCMEKDCIINKPHKEV